MEQLIRLAEMYLYDTCTLSCGYCTLAESGSVSDVMQLQRYKDLSFIDQITAFFTSRTSEHEKWNVVLTGGEPLILPNFEYFCDRLFAAGNRVSIYTNLSISSEHIAFRYLLRKNHRQIDYIMASLHPQVELCEDDFFNKVSKLKAAGHKIIIRYVGHPQRLSKLSKLEDKCREINVCFYPTTLFSKRYPNSYSEKELKQLLSSVNSISQVIQINGGLDVSDRKCLAGSQMIFIDMRNGNITPCISVAKPILGNIYNNELNLIKKNINCPSSNQVCSCDTHFQHDIVVGAEDSLYFVKQKNGFTKILSSEEQAQAIKDKGLLFSHAVLSQGNVQDDGVLFYDKQTLLKRYKNTLRKKQLLRLATIILRPIKRIYSNQR